ncbi:hypothetical protein [Kribbella sp. NPDC006257]|uniref:hypothetical protein n=1 Tax=Kribbella sp. NPDC006257 TaxID=3156738 RepID=UPI00339DAFD9
MARNKRDRGQEPEFQGDRSKAGRRPLPPEPDNWRSMINSDYEYPEELDDLSRRERRRAKKTWRKDDHAARIAWLRNQRQAEPVSPVAIVVLVAIVMIVILGLGGGLPRIFGGDDSSDKSPVGLLTPGRPVVLPTAPASSGTGTEVPVGGPSTGLTTPPPETSRPGAEVTARASDVVGAWARDFYTRDPAAETYAALIARCAKYMTPEVAASFSSAGDPTYDALQKDGGKSTVVAAPVTSPMPNAAPVDTLNRITRFVKVTINVTGKGAQRFDVPLLVTVVSQNNRWLISDVSGGTGP